MRRLLGCEPSQLVVMKINQSIKTQFIDLLYNLDRKSNKAMAA